MTRRALSYRKLPFGFFVFPWSASKLRHTWTPSICRDAKMRFFSFAWLGFEFGQLGDAERGTP